MAEKIDVEVVYALPHEQTLLKVQAPQGATVAEAVRLSGILDRFPEIDIGRNKLGIFGKLSKPDAELHDRDRIEIYRPLIADPKEVRRQRAAEGKVMKKGGGEL
jgi:putative ubiquitin-RnfH superfamily antitoxin RatB of RatAB toxin-antitoxin module